MDLKWDCANICGSMQNLMKYKLCRLVIKKTAKRMEMGLPVGRKWMKRVYSRSVVKQMIFLTDFSCTSKKTMDITRECIIIVNVQGLDFINGHLEISI